MTVNINLRKWQAECLSKALDWLKAGGDKHFLINAAPGSGKTICASVISRKLFEDGLIDRVVVIAPRKSVVEQWATDFQTVTGRPMSKITAADEDAEGYGVDLAATWSAVQGLLDVFQSVCADNRTLVICDEHHHAAVEAAWGRGANGAFSAAKYVVVLTGTPIRSDGKESVWFAYDDLGCIDHPEAGTYTLSYGEAVDSEFCRPITFHRHEGKFTVKLDNGEFIAVSGVDETKMEPRLKRIPGLQRALDYYKLACTPKLLADGRPDTSSYQATMLEWGVEKLNDIRDRMPEAGGLVIAPNIPVAEYMADLLEQIDGERPLIVHSQSGNPEGKIRSFRKSNKRWMVSVAMVSEGVDIPRLRVLVYLPNAQTELAFRQAMGRVVRNHGPNDDTRAYVVMPTHKIFEEYARRVEREMSPAKLREEPSMTKVCPDCGAENPREAKQCAVCDTEFPARKPRLKVCSGCDALNPPAASECQNCGEPFTQDFSITLDEALRVGAIIRGMELEEGEVQESEAIIDDVREAVLKSGDEVLIKILRIMPEESTAKFKKIFQNLK